jgi:hypothetical protein
VAQHTTLDAGTAARLIGSGLAGYWGLSPTVFLLLYTGTEAAFIASHNGGSLLSATLPRQRFAAAAADMIAVGVGFGFGIWIRARKPSSAVS